MQNINWKYYLRIIIESFFCFYIASFSVGVWFIHHPHQVYLTCLILFFYVVVIVGSIYRLLKNLSMPAIMLLAPTGPLVALLMIISLIPVLQHLK